MIGSLFVVGTPTGREEGWAVWQNEHCFKQRGKEKTLEIELRREHDIDHKLTCALWIPLSIVSCELDFNSASVPSNRVGKFDRLL